VSPPERTGWIIRLLKEGYEANIFDKRPDQSGRTGAIVHIAVQTIRPSR
jgi:hypothetical protein